jgi:protein O-mannosyl-transferase
VRAELISKVAICTGLIAITWAVFGQTANYGFVNYDDPAYISENAQVQSGLSWQNVVWAFTHIHSHNWHPLTTLSHMLDCQLFGVQPGAHHLLNVLLHSASAVLLFLLLETMTGRIWSSAFVAAIFAIHPLHVESVAWISERKDVLSGLFLMLMLFAYLWYVRAPSTGRYVTMSILFVCGLLSKPMLVTAPAVLLLIDYWPLNRFGSASVMKLVVEKIPLFTLSLASAAVTLFVQNQGASGLIHFDVLPFSWRITNALAAVLVYIRQMFWPANLALGYSHPGKLPVWQVAESAALLIAITLGVVAARKRRPYLSVGWFWFLVMLLPVIGLVQVGSQAHADRYTYLPQIGLYIAITWFVVDLARSRRTPRIAFAAAAMIVLGALSVCAANQVSYWRGSERLWRHALAVTKDNDVAHLALGQFYADQRKLDAALNELQGVVARHPGDVDARLRLATTLSEKEGRTVDAIAQFKAAIEKEPNPDAETTLGNLLLQQDQIAEAVEHYRNVVQLEPASPLAHYNFAVGLHRLGKLPEAIAEYKQALAIDPKYPDAEHFLGEALLQNGQTDEAKAHLEKR